MDFKMAGTSHGITALQADLKIPGLPIKVVMETIVKGSQAKQQILKKMSETIKKKRPEKKDNWPVVEKFEVPAHLRSHFMGLGGRNLQKITSETGVTLVPSDDNMFDVFAPNKVFDFTVAFPWVHLSAIDTPVWYCFLKLVTPFPLQTALIEAKEMMSSLLMDTREPNLDFGGVYTAKIVELRENGVMITLYPNMIPILLHNTQLDQRKVRKEGMIAPISPK